METAKEKAIREAYGEHWDKVKDFVDDNGYIYEDDAKDILWKKLVNGIIHSRIYHVEVDIIDRGCYDDMRPKSLQGIETNNGWTRIESEADLPTEQCLYKVILKTGEFDTYPFMKDDEEYWINTFSHYEKIEFKKPIY